ncbi:Presenilin [Aphelenchoides bicaudatus]|nr:Presenilin [Aphelenchoides bicaudatus]
MANEDGVCVEMASDSNGHQSSQTNLVNGRSRAARPRNNHQSAQAESSLSSNQREREQLDSNEIKYSAAHVIYLFVPVSLCMLAVIISMQTIGYFGRDDGVYLVYTPFTKQTESASELFFMSIGNAAILLGVVIVMTIILILLYKFRFYRASQLNFVIHGWLVMSSVMLLGLFSAVYFEELFKNCNLAVDSITFAFLCWNFAAVGMIAVHWKSPHRLQQAYLIMMSSLMSLIFIKHLPEWSVWTVLAFLAIWDLVAVLCPYGPLRILVETAQQRNEPIFPSLIYSSAVIYPYVLVADSTEPESSKKAETPEDPAPTTSDQPVENTQPAQIQPLTTTGQRIAPLRGHRQTSSSAMLIDSANNIDTETSESIQNPNQQQQNQEHQEEERGVKLGLGDFIFYSVLVGKASSYGDWNTTIACYVAILLGLSCTLMLLALFRKALPALPISIFAGIIFYFSTRGIITPIFTEINGYYYGQNVMI